MGGVRGTSNIGPEWACRRERLSYRKDVFDTVECKI